MQSLLKKNNIKHVVFLSIDQQTDEDIGGASESTRLAPPTFLTVGSDLGRVCYFRGRILTRL